MNKYARSRYQFAIFHPSKPIMTLKKCKMNLRKCRKCMFAVSARRANAPKQHGDTETRRFFSKRQCRKQRWYFENVPPCLRVSVCFFLREQPPLGAAGVGLVVGAVAQCRKRELREHAIPAVARMEAVRRVIRRLIQARV